MKSTELRIGNLTEYFIKDKLDKRKERWEVNILDIDDIADIDHLGFELAGYRPIPLTEEWLLKIGFIFGIKLQDFAKGKYQFTQLKNNILYGEFSEECIFYFNTKTKIQYIHQLQNLYFALTGEELVVSDAVS